MDLDKRAENIKKAFDATKEQIEIKAKELEDLKNRLQQMLGSYQTIVELKKESEPKKEVSGKKKNKQQAKGK